MVSCRHGQLLGIISALLWAPVCVRALHLRGWRVGGSTRAVDQGPAVMVQTTCRPTAADVRQQACPLCRREQHGHRPTTPGAGLHAHARSNVAGNAVLPCHPAWRGIAAGWRAASAAHLAGVACWQQRQHMAGLGQAGWAPDATSHPMRGGGGVREGRHGSIVPRHSCGLVVLKNTS